MSYPAPVGIIPLATSTWQGDKPKQQYFYRHSYTCPTPREFAFQGIGLAISNAIAIHMRDAKEGKFIEPSDEEKAEFEMYEQLMVLDTDDELVIPHISTATLEEPIIYPSPNFTIPLRHTTETCTWYVRLNLKRNGFVPNPSLTAGRT